MFGHWTYLVLDLGSLLFPLLLSFDKKVAFYKDWRYLFPGILAGMLVFIPWDEWFTRAGIWSFNPEYLTGIHIGSLPLEEWLFFIVVPYACVFIYACLNAYLGDPLQKLGPWFFVGMAVLSAVLVSGWYHRTYPLVTFGLIPFAMGWHYYVFGTRLMGKITFMWLVHLVPLFLINGVLTSEPVVRYNDFENLGIRIGTVPFEDSFYSFLLLLIVVSVMEYLKEKSKAKT